MPRTGREPHALDRAAVGGEHQVEARQIKTLGCGGVEREEVAVVRASERKILEKGGVERAFCECWRQAGRSGDEGEDVGAGEEGGDALGDAFASAPSDEPMMDDSYAQRRLPWPE